jgi:hypothetical protein
MSVTIDIKSARTYRVSGFHVASDDQPHRTVG